MAKLLLVFIFFISFSNSMEEFNKKREKAQTCIEDARKVLKSKDLHELPYQLKSNYKFYDLLETMRKNFENSKNSFKKSQFPKDLKEGMEKVQEKINSLEKKKSNLKKIIQQNQNIIDEENSKEAIERANLLPSLKNIIVDYSK